MGATLNNLVERVNKTQQTDEQDNPVRARLLQPRGVITTVNAGPPRIAARAGRHRSSKLCRSSTHTCRRSSGSTRTQRRCSRACKSSRGRARPCGWTRSGSTGPGCEDGGAANVQKCRAPKLISFRLVRRSVLQKKHNMGAQPLHDKCRNREAPRCLSAPAAGTRCQSVRGWGRRPHVRKKTQCVQTPSLVFCSAATVHKPARNYTRRARRTRRAARCTNVPAGADGAYP